MRDIPVIDSMVRYQVHFEYTNKRANRVKRGCRHVVARNEDEAKTRVRSSVPSSFGIWINRLANEVVG
jgi:hypothetical protein